MVARYEQYLRWKTTQPDVAGVDDALAEAKLAERQLIARLTMYRPRRASGGPQQKHGLVREQGEK